MININVQEILTFNVIYIAQTNYLSDDFDAFVNKMFAPLIFDDNFFFLI